MLEDEDWRCKVVPPYRATLLIRTPPPPVGPKSRPMPREVWWAWGGWRFLMKVRPYALRPLAVCTKFLPTCLSCAERLVFHCRTTSASIAPCTSRRMCCPTHCARYSAPCQPLLRAFAFCKTLPRALCETLLPAVRSHLPCEDRPLSSEYSRANSYP
jgi:hypothetical protein